MKYTSRLALAAFMVTNLAACSSGSEARRQANQDFNYLETPTLTSWTLPAGAVPFSTASYAIPDQAVTGNVGANVDIRPPQQVLNLIPGMRSHVDLEGVTVQFPRTSDLTKVWQITQQLISTNNIGVLKQSADRIETDWVNWTNKDEDHEIGSRYSIEKWPATNGYRITLTDWREDGNTTPVSVSNKRRYSILMTNLVMAKYDQDSREQARLAAEKQRQHVPVSLGSDRSGLPVLIARAPYDNMWVRLPNVLAELGFTVIDRSRSQGLIEVKYNEPDDMVWQTLGTEPVALSEAKYRILVGDLGNRTSINITDDEGKPVEQSALDSMAPALTAAFQK